MENVRNFESKTSINIKNRVNYLCQSLGYKILQQQKAKTKEKKNKRTHIREQSLNTKEYKFLLKCVKRTTVIAVKQ